MMGPAVSEQDAGEAGEVVAPPWGHRFGVDRTTKAHTYRTLRPGTMAGPAGNALELVRLFADVARADPLAAVLLVAGAVLVGGPVLLFGYLTVGAVLEALTTEPSG